MNRLDAMSFPYAGEMTCQKRFLPMKQRRTTRVDSAAHKNRAYPALVHP